MSAEELPRGGLRRLCGRHACGELSTVHYRAARRSFIESVVAGRLQADADAPGVAGVEPDTFLATQPLPARWRAPPRRSLMLRVLTSLGLSIALVTAAFMAFITFTS
ncbi:MAG TPA: hypothetical protein DCY89_08730 [Gammaproteobacteria bacterium]|nr:hypothetical protein [Gammaproteobacteria bacterium]